GRVYAGDRSGYVQCLDARTGHKFWEYDLKDGTWASPFYADGKVFLGTDGGDLFVFKAGKELHEPAKIDMEQALKGDPVVAVNGVLYWNNGFCLYAICPPEGVEART